MVLQPCVSAQLLWIMLHQMHELLSTHTFCSIAVPLVLPQRPCTNVVPACSCHEFTELAAGEVAES